MNPTSYRWFLLGFGVYALFLVIADCTMRYSLRSKQELEMAQMLDARNIPTTAIDGYLIEYYNRKIFVARNGRFFCVAGTPNYRICDIRRHFDSRAKFFPRAKTS